jgi:hypothetical protein
MFSAADIVAENARTGAENWLVRTPTVDTIQGGVLIPGERPYWGDVDLTGDVGGDDLTIFANHLGVTENMSWGNGDFDHDGDVDANDLTVFQNNFGKGVGDPL